jgi:sec-independent protein translocase protein TatA
MIPGFHGADLIVILLIALLVFGPKKLPEMGSAIGKSIKEFRKGMNELSAPKEDAKSVDSIKFELEAAQRELANLKNFSTASEVAQPEVPVNAEVKAE